MFLLLLLACARNPAALDGLPLDDASPVPTAANMEPPERKLRRLALDGHHRARHTGDRALLSYTAALYAQYLHRFAAHSHANEMRCAYAEALYELDRYDESLRAYTQMHAASEDQQAQRCAHTAVDAAQRLLEATEAPPGPSQQTDLSPTALRYRDILEEYITRYPDSSDTTGMVYRLGHLYYQHGQLERSTRLFFTVISRQPDHPNAEQATNLILYSYLLQEDWPALTHTTQYLLSRPGFGSASLRTMMALVQDHAAAHRPE